MTDDRKYVRVYYSIVDDDRFATVIDDEATLGTWLRLLMSADAVWPASADIPRWVKPDALARLVDAGIVELVAGDRFRIHGLDNERERRSQVGRAGGLASGRVRGTGTTVRRSFNDRSTNVERKGNLDEQRRDETSTSRDEKVPAHARETWPSDVPEIVQHAWHRRMKRPPTPRQIGAIRMKPSTWREVALLIDGAPAGAKASDIVKHVLDGLTAELSAGRLEEAQRSTHKERGRPGGSPTRIGEILPGLNGIGDGP